MLRAMKLVVIHYLLEYRRKDDLTENLARAVENFATLFHI